MELNLLYGVEGVTGLDETGILRDRDTVEVGWEALDGRIVHGGWGFLFTDGNGTLHGVRVHGDGEVSTFEGAKAGSRSVNPILGAPLVDTQAPILECRRAGADEYFTETGENIIQYLARPVGGRDAEPNWTLFAIFTTLARLPGEIEAAACHMDQLTGNVTYVPAENYGNDYEPT